MNFRYFPGLVQLVRRLLALTKVGGVSFGRHIKTRRGFFVSRGDIFGRGLRGVFAL